MTGYDHPDFVSSLAHDQSPVMLKGSGAWLIERSIEATQLFDATGIYPVTRCENWSAIHADIEAVGDRWVTVSFVPDPLSLPPDCHRQLENFDVVRKFKDHFFVDLDDNWQAAISKHHRYTWRKARRVVNVRRESVTAELCQEWVDLYMAHVRRKSIVGSAAPSPDCLKQQLRVPGMVVYRATTSDNQLCGMALWATCNKHCYYHLAACTDRGYALGASYALVGDGLDDFHQDAVIEKVSLGGGAGLRIEPGDGLVRFKRGWSSQTATAYFIGKVTNKSAYELLTAGQPKKQFFPSYRHGQ